MSKYIKLCILCFVIVIAGCASKKDSQTNYPKKRDFDVSATSVVKIFLESLKSKDFSKAYDNIYIVNSDKEGYIARMESVSSQTGTKLLGYKILGSQLFRNSAIIVAELQISQRSFDNENVIRITRNRYDLSLIEDSWKITKDTCIENCKLEGE